jgi:catechol 2,3-dioxygenase-like lactoylglutathione lyase family enzyme
MAITLNHTIVPARDKEASARFFADIFGLKYEGRVDTLPRCASMRA